MNSNNIYGLISLIFCVLVGCKGHQEALTNRLDLAGEWGFKEDAGDIGIRERWFEKMSDEVVTLPGSMASNGKGDEIRVNTPWTGSIFDSAYFHQPAYEAYRQEGNIKVPF